MKSRTRNLSALNQHEKFTFKLIYISFPWSQICWTLAYDTWENKLFVAIKFLKYFMRVVFLVLIKLFKYFSRITWMTKRINRFQKWSFQSLAIYMEKMISHNFLFLIFRRRLHNIQKTTTYYKMLMISFGQGRGGAVLDKPDDYHVSFLLPRYYEFEVISPGYMRCGWAKVDASSYCEIGSDERGYSFDGSGVSTLTFSDKTNKSKKNTPTNRKKT